MASRFVPVDHDTPLLLPPDIRDWVPSDHLVHFVMDVVSLMDLGAAHVNHRGTGDRQFPPRMMLGLLVYSYATGTFSSRRIERSTQDSVAVRMLCADTHPDHDTLCKFRRENRALLESAFQQVLECAARAKVLQVGNITLAIDGTKILANASKHSAMSHDHALKQMNLLDEEIAALLAKAEEADATPLRDGPGIPGEIRRREDRKAAIQVGLDEIRARAEERHRQEKAAHEEKLRARGEKEKATGKKAKGKAPKPPEPGPRAKDQYNFTDPESRIMKAGNGAHFEQAYNGQAGVEIESRLIVVERLSDAPNDKQELGPVLEVLSPVVESVEAVLVDNGYYSEAAVTAAEGNAEGALEGVTVYAPRSRQRHGRSVSELEARPDPEPPGEGATVRETMDHRLGTAAGKALYGKRKETIEPVFGIIKEAMGFRRFRLRGREKAGLEWTLVTLSYNVKRLFHMKAVLAGA